MIIDSRPVARHGIVVGYRQQVDSAGQRAIDKLGWRQGAVRSAGMGVEVNQHNLYT